MSIFSQHRVCEIPEQGSLRDEFRGRPIFLLLSLHAVTNTSFPHQIRPPTSLVHHIFHLQFIALPLLLLKAPSLSARQEKERLWDYHYGPNGILHCTIERYLIEYSVVLHSIHLIKSKIN